MSVGWQPGPPPWPMPPQLLGPHTPDGVPLASWGQRFWAFVLDLVPLWVVGGVLLGKWNRTYANELLGLWVQTGIGNAPFPGPSEMWARGLVQMWLLNGIFHVLFTASWDALWWWLMGATPGQKILGLRIVPAGQGRFEGRLPVQTIVRRAVLRRCLDGFVHPLYWLSSLGVQSPRVQSWPDRFAATQVVAGRR